MGSLGLRSEYGRGNRFSFTLGIIVDDTVHFINKYIYARRTLDLDTDSALAYAFNVVGKALVTTTVVLACGFWLLSYSDFNVNAYMGAMVSVTIIAALVLDLILLPLSLYYLDRKFSKQAQTATT